MNVREGEASVHKRRRDVAQPRDTLARVQYLPAQRDCGPFSAFSFSIRNRSCPWRSNPGTVAYVAVSPASLSHSTLLVPRDSTNATAYRGLCYVTRCERSTRHYRYISLATTTVATHVQYNTLLLLLGIRLPSKNFD